MKILVYTLIGVIVGILAFTMWRSYMVLNRGVEIREEKTGEEETSVKDDRTSWPQINAKIFSELYLFYPIEPLTETGGVGPDEVQTHARNLVFTNTITKRTRKVFKKDVYIKDFFNGKFSRKKNKPDTAGNVMDSLDVENAFIILAATVDTNHDGFLNSKDALKFYIYFPAEEKTFNILPEKYFFERLIFNSKKNQIVCLVSYLDKKVEKESRKVSYFSYNTITRKGMILPAE